MKPGEIVKFKQPMEEGEEELRMRVVEDRGDRILVCSAYYKVAGIPIQNVYKTSDLEIVSE